MSAAMHKLFGGSRNRLAGENVFLRDCSISRAAFKECSFCTSKVPSQ